jgi:predicted small secreted protein
MEALRAQGRCCARFVRDKFKPVQIVVVWIGDIMVKTILATLLLLGVFGSLAGCNTVDGVGKDLGAAGAATSDTARDVGRKM